MAIIDNPSVGNFEELGDLYLDDRQYAQAREYLTKVIDKNPGTPDPFYRRALAAIATEDYQSALGDLIQVYHLDDKYDYQRAAGLLALMMAKTGDRERAVALFDDVLQTSTLSEIQYNYASTLAEMGRKDDARAWAQRILAKKPSMPKYVRRQERPWFRKANALIKKLGSA
jgi:tetratricopeptide (TPR) repeat protein